MHCTTRTSRIWTNKPVYWDSHVGNLDKTRFGEPLRCPLQHRLDGDGQRCLSVAVHDHTAPLASIQGIVSRVMSVVHCTAMRTPLGSVASVNNLKRYAKLLAIRFKKFSELGVRNMVNPPVSLFARLVFLSSNTKLFNGNRGAIRLGKVHDFFGDLAASGLDKVSLLVLKPHEIFLGLARAVISMALKLASPLKVSPLPLGNLSAEVELFDHFGGLSIKNGNGCKGGRANIDTNDKPSIVRWFRKSPFKDDSGLPLFQEGDVFKTPSTIKEGVKSLKLPVESKGDYKTLPRGVCDSKA